MSAEEFRPVPGYEGLYEVSNFGTVRSVLRSVVDSRGQRRTFQGKTLVAAKDSQTRYLHVGLYRNGKGRTVWVHSLVAAAFLGPRPEGAQVAHGDGNRQNNNLTNLRYATVAENQADRIAHRTSNRGEKHGMSKLKCEQVIEIRRLLAAGKTQQSVADQFGISRSWVGCIGQWKVWQHPCTDCGRRWHASWKREVAA